MKLRLGLAFCLMIFLTACNLVPFNDTGQETAGASEEDVLSTGIDQNVSNEAQARTAVVDIYNSLNQGDYDQAAGLYGGPYDVLQGYNPGIDPGDRAGLLSAGCEFNGLMCLKVLEMTLIHANEPHKFVFDVTFANPDGSLFILGPCCGATEEEMPPVSGFTVHVACEQEGTCQVLDLPPYVP